MRVVSLVNGSLLSEAATLYAITYAKSMQLPLTLLFIDNGDESLEKHRLAVSSLKELAASQEVEVESVTLKGDTLTQLQHFSRLYAIDTLFCATRKFTKDHSFSDKIVKAGLQTDVAVVKIKSVPKVRGYRRVFFAAGDSPHPRAFLLWLGLLEDESVLGKLCLTPRSYHGFRRTDSSSKRQYIAAPFLQLARMLHKNVEMVSVLQPHNATELYNYLLVNCFDLVLFDAAAYPQKLLNRVTDATATNSILFYPRKS
ncbi:universal stress protein [Thiomicrorhabdus sp. zzn3]|uniref:universal stress protein n=1 Tax=Thiomicrorhabdus sp. zzn3 TaxID=3039775 RepID=UPI00243726AB|nr:universal stress protein [Thiomicrorhabdus sp. zzn3]MDG6778835.1 universal stress protein [Thiomicrorhabdus sp. zzn3]